MPDSHCSQMLYSTAEAYLALGYSVIPVWGDADLARAKVAAVEWSTFQRRRPSLHEVHDWFFVSGFAGLAIVTGSISQLVVLDFDTPEGFHAFSKQYPDLVEQQVIQTRRGFHVYFHLPAHLNLPSRKAPGIDLLSTGRYVIARPTCIDGHIYTLIRGGQPKTLTQADVNSINRFIDAHGGAVTSSAPECDLVASASNSSGIEPRYQPPQPSVSELQNQYQRLIEQGGGRNNALFQVSLKARDNGCSVNTALVALAEHHAVQLTPARHRDETPNQRYLEARRTIQSAFSRPARNLQSNRQIPNRVREQLFKSGETRVVRVIEALRLKGVQSGETFTIRLALELLQGIVGRDSVYAALKAVSPAGQSIFKRANPSPTTPSAANAAINRKQLTNKCFIGRAKKPGISPNHRPATLYILPNNDELCQILGVKSSHSDAITLDDLTSAKRTRMAAHRELIRRRPGVYPRRWLARRLGVVADTLDTYNRQIDGLHWQPCFWEQPIFYWNLNRVPDDIEVYGAVLIDETGKRYPASRQIAARLLGWGRRVVYQRQDANYYWYGESAPYPGLNLEARLQKNKPAAEGEALQSYFRLLPPPAAQRSKPVAPVTPLSAPSQPAKTIPDIVETKPAAPVNYRKALNDNAQEAVALRIYDTLNKNSADPAQRISQATARRLVHNNGLAAVEKALKLLAGRHNITNPVGFFITVLRSERLR